MSLVFSFTSANKSLAPSEITSPARIASLATDLSALRPSGIANKTTAAKPQRPVTASHNFSNINTPPCLTDKYSFAAASRQNSQNLGLLGNRLLNHCLRFLLYPRKRIFISYQPYIQETLDKAVICRLENNNLL